MKLKKLLTMALAGALVIGGVITANAAELDTAWYAEQNPDVVAEVGNSPEALKLHYEMYGKKEARMANTHDVEAQLRKLFKAEEYGTLYPDVKEFYGEDEEAMFQHYISYGLLEARRPCEKVTQAVARSLKETVEKAMTDAGLIATPGSADIMAVIEGAVSEESGSVEAVQALTEVATVVEKAVTETYEEVTNPKPAPSNDGGSSTSSSSSSSSSSSAGNSGSGTEPCNTHDWSKKDGVCAICRMECAHDWGEGEEAICSTCGMRCQHTSCKPDNQNTNKHKCESCEMVLDHEFKDGKCSCGAEEPKEQSGEKE